MTTATYHPTTGLGQDVWSQSIQGQPGSLPLYGGAIPFAQPYGQQPFGPFGAQGFGVQPFQAQQFQPQQFASPQPWTQPWTQAWQQAFGSPAGAQILAVLPALIAQQAQQLYSIAQMCAQQVPTFAYQSSLVQPGLRQYQMGY